MKELIERLEKADEATQYAAMREAVEFLWPRSNLNTLNWRTICHAAIDSAEAFPRSAPLMLGVAAMMVPEGMGYSVMTHCRDRSPVGPRAYVDGIPVDAPVPACTLAAACLKSRSVSEGKT